VRVVGFKLEADRPPDELVERARRLREEYDLDWVVANDRAAMGPVPRVHVSVVTRAGRVHRLEGTKEEVAAKLVDDLGRELATVVSWRPGAAAARSAGRRRRRSSRAAATR
jgi:phosphopantothenoylcysteine synthetase/decarboxylase